MSLFAGEYWSARPVIAIRFQRSTNRSLAFVSVPNPFVILRQSQRVLIVGKRFRVAEVMRPGHDDLERNVANQVKEYPTSLGLSRVNLSLQLRAIREEILEDIDSGLGFHLEDAQGRTADLVNVATTRALRAGCEEQQLDGRFGM